METVGKSFKRVDAWGKVTGEAKYTNDLMPKDCLQAKVVRSTITNGLVKSIDLCRPSERADPGWISCK